MAHELDNYWFAAKRDGCGSGLPIAWQGWAASAAYAAVITAAAFFLPQRSLIGFAAIALASTTVFLMVCAQKTRGGWQWPRSGACAGSNPRRQLLLAVATALLVLGAALYAALD